MKYLKNKKGFTIVEMVLVIGAMAALALILVPNATAYVQKADDSRVENNIREVRRASELVIQTNPSISMRGIYELTTAEKEKIINEISTYANIDYDKMKIVEYALANENFEIGKYFISPDQTENKVIVRYNTDRGTYWVEKKDKDVAGGVNSQGRPIAPSQPGDSDDDFTFEPNDGAIVGKDVVTDNSRNGFATVEVNGKSYQPPTTGKNLFPGVSSLFPSTSYSSSTISLKVEPNTQYTVSSNVPGSSAGDPNQNRHIYINGTGAQDAAFHNHPITRTSDRNGNLVMHLYYSRQYTESLLKEDYWVQVEKGPSFTGYVEYGDKDPYPGIPSTINSLDKFDIVSSTSMKSKSELAGIPYDTITNGVYKTRISLSAPLRSVGNSHDRLFKDSDNLWKIERNIGEKVVSDGWNRYGTGERDELTTVQVLVEDTIFGYRTSVSSHFKNVVGGWDRHEHGVGYSDHTYVPRKYFHFDNNLVGIKPTDSSALRISKITEWTRKNPITIIYQLAESKTVTLSRVAQEKLNSIPSFAGKNYVYTVLDNENLTPVLNVKFKD